MSEIKHTPGPWVITDYADKDIIVRSASDDGWNYMEAYINDDDCDHDAAVANARLIAAAPDLLEALYLILPLARGYAAQNQVGSNAEYVDAAEEAIAKAEGRQ